MKYMASFFLRLILGQYLAQKSSSKGWECVTAIQRPHLQRRTLKFFSSLSALDDVSPGTPLPVVSTSVELSL